MNTTQLMEHRRARIAKLTDDFQALAAGEDVDVVVSVLVSSFLQATVCIPDLRQVILENVQRMQRQIEAMRDLPPEEASAAAFALSEGHAFSPEDVDADAASAAQPVRH